MKRNLICQLLRFVYGFKQAAHGWNQKIHGLLIEIGFIRFDADPCLYIGTKQNIYIMLWVEDLLIARKNGWDIGDLKVELAGEFEMKDLGELKHFLGMRIMGNSSGGIFINQSGFICQVLERYRMSMLLEPGAHPIKATELDHEEWIWNFTKEW